MDAAAVSDNTRAGRIRSPTIAPARLRPDDRTTATGLAHSSGSSHSHGTSTGRAEATAAAAGPDHRRPWPRRPGRTNTAALLDQPPQPQPRRHRRRRCGLWTAVQLVLLIMAVTVGLVQVAHFHANLSPLAAAAAATVPHALLRAARNAPARASRAAAPAAGTARPANIRHEARGAPTTKSGERAVGTNGALTTRPVAEIVGTAAAAATHEEGSSNASSAAADASNPLLRLFQSAGVSLDEELTAADRALLPTVYAVLQDTYGGGGGGGAGGGGADRPVIVGRERCGAYRASVPPSRRYAAVAGLFNTGTNAMEYHLRKNLRPPYNSTLTAAAWQVPWGKHRVPAVRLQHVAPNMGHWVQQDALPIVMLRDPYHWMQSMCKSPYAAKWKRTKQHCPNLVPTAPDLEKFAEELKRSSNQFNVTVFFDKNQIISWDSLVHLYSDWNRQYLDAAYPRLLIRFEDMLLHAPAVLQAIADCTGGTVAAPFSYQTGSAKQHGSRTNFVKAVLKSGSAAARLQRLTPDDVRYAAQHLDAPLMDAMHYSIPTAPLLSG